MNLIQDDLYVVGLRVMKVPGEYGIWKVPYGDGAWHGHECIKQIDVLLGLSYDSKPSFIVRLEVYGEVESTDPNCNDINSTFCTHDVIKVYGDYGPMTHRPKYKLPFYGHIGYDAGERYALCDNNGEIVRADAVNNVFCFSEIGYTNDEQHEPRGWASVNMDLFVEVKSMELPPIWIFRGGRNTGKSYLAYKLFGEDSLVLDTDYSTGINIEDPETVDKFGGTMHDIKCIVIGSDSELTVQQLIPIIPDNRKIIVVDFNDLR